jgi:hypothetical protein
MINKHEFNRAVKHFGNQTRMAEAANVSRQFVSQIATKDCPPPRWFVWFIRKETGIDILK